MVTFSNSGLATCDVHQNESRFAWNYIRYLRNNKGRDINVDTLLDQGKLANIFKISTINKLAFNDTPISTIDYNRNKKFQTKSIIDDLDNKQFQTKSTIDDLDIDTVDIGKLNPEIKASHYKTASTNENIMRQNYFMFLELYHRLQTLPPNRIKHNTQNNNLIEFKVELFFFDVINSAISFWQKACIICCIFIVMPLLAVEYIC